MVFQSVGWGITAWEAVRSKACDGSVSSEAERPLPKISWEPLASVARASSASLLDDARVIGGSTYLCRREFRQSTTPQMRRVYLRASPGRGAHGTPPRCLRKGESTQAPCCCPWGS